MKKTHYSDKPSRLFIGKTFVLFRWGIEQVGEGDWASYEIRIDNPISVSKAVEEVFSVYYGNNHENKLINEYNSAKLGLLNEEDAEKAITNYTNFLTERAELKADIENVITTAIEFNQI